MKKMMMFAALVAAGCSATTSQQAPADTDAGVDAVDAPDPGEPCEAGAFLGCSGNLAKRCAADGVTVTQETCDSGCNASAERCNECDPNAVTCSGGELQTCGADGLVASTESCTLGCVEGQGTACGHIVPEFLPTVCDVPAAQPALTIPSGQANRIDTDVAANCTGGIINNVCVVRFGTISVEGPLEVIGSRAIALVADRALDVANIIDVSARGQTSGPGGGRRVSGDAPSSKNSGGGAGGKQSGAQGGEFDQTHLGGAGGSVIDPMTTLVFEGGARAADAPPAGANYRPKGGGGGGALMLVSCRGEVRVTGTIEAGGGGGGAGGDGLATPVTSLFFGGAGGGAGGYAVLQGAKVSVSGRLFANGGGGGGGCGLNDCIAGDGGDAAQVRARGGGREDSGGSGGQGGFDATAPDRGGAGTFSGGGGGSVGRFQIFTPAGVTPTNTATSMPAFESNRTVGVR